MQKIHFTAKSAKNAKGFLK